MKIPDIPLEEYITGEKFGALCDINSEKDENFENTIRSSGKNVLTFFCQTHELRNRMPVFEKFQDKKFIVVSHNSDGSFQKEERTRWFDYQWAGREKVVHWFAQNCEVDSMTVTPIPIGHENEAIFADKTSNVKHKVIIDWNKKNVPKQNKMFLCVRVGTNPKDREYAVQKFRHLPWVTHQEGENGVEYVASYFEQMAKHQFILCPEGNGFDTVRLWEALYMGCIPIVSRRHFTEVFARHLPIIVVDHFDEITSEMLKKNLVEMENQTYDYNILNMSHWREKIIELTKAVYG